MDGELIIVVGYELGEGTVALRWGSPEMIQEATLGALREWGYVEKENCFGFSRYLVYVERDIMAWLVLELIPGGMKSVLKLEHQLGKLRL